MKPTILFGPAGLGSPASEGLTQIHSLNLKAAEVEFTYGVNITNEYAVSVGALAEKLDISLSVHAPYYINLASEETSKRKASVHRILESAERAHFLKARFVVFHPAFYGKLKKEDVYKIVKESILEMQETMKKNNWDIILTPETTGKPTSFGDLGELIKLSKETGCGVCIDFAHLYARNNGNIDYDEVCKKIKSLNQEKITAHFSGIAFTAKGEKNHTITPENHAKELLEFLKKYSISIRIINESPQCIKDAVMMQKIYNSL